MAEEVARLVAVVEANLKGFTKGMEDMNRIADRRFGALEKRMKQSERGFANFGRGLRNFVLGGAALAGISRFVSSVTDAVGKIQDTSDALGISTDALQTWGIVAGRSGIRQEELNKALGSFTQRLGEAQIKGGPFAKFLEGIGVGTKGNPEEVLLRIADAVKNTASQQQKAAIVGEALGARYVRLVPLFEQGADGLSKLNAEFVKNGQIIGRETLAKIDELEDKWGELKKQFTVIGANVLGGIADEFSEFSANFTDPEFQAALRDFGKILADAAIAVAKIGAGIGGVAGALGFTSGDEITELRELINQWKEFKFAPGSLGLEELEKAEKRLRDLLRQRAERAGLGPDFKISTGAPGVDRTGQLNTDAENAKTLVDQSRADLEAARADLVRASGESAVAIEQNLARRYEIERDNIVINTDAAIRAAEEKKDAEITALEAQLRQGKVNAEQFNQIRINKELEFDAKRAELVEKQRADTVKLYDDEFERALELSRKLEDLRRDSLENRAEQERRAQESRTELDIAKEQANTGFFAPGGDSEAVLDLKRRQIEETAAMEEQAAQDRLERDLESLERQKSDLEARGEIWAEYEQARVDATAAAEAEIEQIRNDGAARRVEIEEQADKQRQDNLRDSLNTIATLTSSSNDTLKAIGKAAAIATATMDGIVAVNKALAALPPPFNFALAAAVGAAVGANIAKIAAMEHGGRVQAGTPYIVGEKRPELFVPDQAGTIIPRIPTAMAKSGVTGSSGPITITIDARGAQEGVADQVGAAVGRAMRRFERRLPGMMSVADRDYR